MRIVTVPCAPERERTALCLGNFDGFHKAHRLLVQNCALYARAHALVCAAFTFFPSPKTELLLSTREEKCAFLEDAGVELLFCAPFEDLRSLAPERFVNDYILNTFHASAVFCGYNFTFGRDRAGNVRTLRELLPPDCDLQILERQTENGETISSSAIRDLVRAGKIRRAEELSGHPLCPSVRSKL